MGFWLFAAFVGVPIVEIALFIQVGGLIGLWPTLAIVILTAIAGSYLMRREGSATLGQLRRALGEGGDPSRPLAHGALILVAGVLLLTPGFFTDAVGLALMVPPVRRAVIAFLSRHLAARMQVHHASFTVHGGPGPGPRHRADIDIVEGEYEDVSANRDRQAPRPGRDEPPARPRD
ncbi:MAG: FxsA family protein [Alphaproteobacteria bacterium]|nr:MAG: FxsA family protein [Alphaproteobacteria bacterium]